MLLLDYQLYILWREGAKTKRIQKNLEDFSYRKTPRIV